MDSGAERPIGFGYSIIHMARGKDPATPQMNNEQQKSFAICEQIAELLKGIDATHVRPFGGGEDIDPLTKDGVPSFSPSSAGTHYFDWHHTTADTLDKINPEDFNRNIAVLAVLSYVLADMPGQLAGIPAVADR
jgi:Zn-dependent M28 family amino/carboxypeptidase